MESSLENVFGQHKKILVGQWVQVYEGVAFWPTLLNHRPTWLHWPTGWPVGQFRRSVDQSGQPVGQTESLISGPEQSETNRALWDGTRLTKTPPPQMKSSHPFSRVVTALICLPNCTGARKEGEKGSHSFVLVPVGSTQSYPSTTAAPRWGEIFLVARSVTVESEFHLSHMLQKTQPRHRPSCLVLINASDGTNSWFQTLYQYKLEHV